MRIDDILLCVPRSFFLGTIAKIPRFELSQKAIEAATQHGMYHFVSDEKTADDIVNSEYLRPSTNFISYGRKCAFMFCGAPSIDNYAKNLTNSKHINNPYTDPTMVQIAVKFMPQKKDLVNYRFRGLTDSVFTYEGTCILPHNKVKKVFMVPDLVRDNEQNPILDSNGEYQVSFREAMLDEIMPNGKNYMAKPDYLEYMRKKAIEFGYLNKDAKEIFLLLKPVVLIKDLARMEGDEARRNFGENALDISKNMLNKIKKFFKKNSLQESTENILEKYSLARKNPFRDAKFAQQIAKLQVHEGIVQSDLRDMLEEFNQSNDGHFFSQKYKQINSMIDKDGIHGKYHSDRVTLSVMMIAHNEGILENDSNNRIKDILITASMYHDIGRVLNVGPHGRRGAKIIEKMTLRYSDGTPYTAEDKALVMALVEAHEGKDDRIQKALQKYKISSQENIELAKSLSSIIRDADALDRVRLDRNYLGYKVNLNPERLRNNTAKGMILQAYQLEYLIKMVPNMNNILQFGTKNNLVNEKSRSEAFRESTRIPPEKQLSSLKPPQQPLKTIQNDSNNKSR